MASWLRIGLFKIGKYLSLAIEKITHLEYVREVRIMQFENYGSSLSVIRALAGQAITVKPMEGNKEVTTLDSL